MLFVAAVAVALVALLRLLTRSPYDPKRRAQVLAMTPEELERVHKQGFSAKALPAGDLDAIVIGSGPGGLTTAATLARLGKRVLVLEQHDVAGGCSHSFTDNKFEFDTGIHYIGEEFNDKLSMTRRVVDFVSQGSLEFAPMDEHFDVAVFDFQKPPAEQYRFPVPSDKERFKAELKKQWPAEAAAIDKYFALVFDVFACSPGFFALKLLPGWLAALLKPFMATRFLAYNALTAKEVLDRLFEDDKLKAVLTYQWGDTGDMPSRSSFAMQAMLMRHYFKGATFPEGGTHTIAQRIVPTVEAAGGKVLVRAPVDAILVDGAGAARGVVVKGQQIMAPVVVSAAGAINTFTKLVPREAAERFVPHILRDIQAGKLKPSTAHCTLFVGLDLPQEQLQLPAENLWCYGSTDMDAIAAMGEQWTDFADWARRPEVPGAFVSSASARDPTYAARHPGKSVVSVLTDLPYRLFAPWADGRIKHRGAEYEQAKAVLTEHLLEVLYNNYPQCRGHVVFTDLGTPLSQEYYLGSVDGASYGCQHTPQRFQLPWLRYETPIKGLFLSGQDVVTNGVCGGLMGGFLCGVRVGGFFNALKMLNLLVPWTWEQFKETQSPGFLRPSI